MEEEAGEPVESPHMHEENVQTPHREDPAGIRTF